jgi:hypothetical protein
VAALEGGAPLSDDDFERAKRQAAQTVLFGVAAG